jgi:hypothetical protein
MQKRLFAIAFATLGFMLPASVAWALIAAPPPGPTRVVNSDAVFVGRVIEFEPVDVDAKPFPQAKEPVKYRIAIVQVNEIIRGLKAEKTVRVGFAVPVQPKPGKPISSGGLRNPQLQAGQEGLFMINKHAEGKFYQAPGFGYFTPMNQKDFDNEVKTAKKVVQILGNTKTALQSQDADERLLAASIVISQYRTPKGFPNREEPIDAEESKLILKALADAKWGPVRFGQAHPQQLFFQLGVRAEDGWKQPTKIATPDDLPNAIKGWLREHADTYRIKRYVQASDR